MPIKKFEELLRDEKQIDAQGLVYKQVEPMHIREFIDTNFVSDSMLNNVLGPVVFFEVFDGSYPRKLLREGEQKMSVYAKVFYLREREGYRQYYCSLMDISRVI